MYFLISTLELRVLLFANLIEFEKIYSDLKVGSDNLRLINSYPHFNAFFNILLF